MNDFFLVFDHCAPKKKLLPRIQRPFQPLCNSDSARAFLLLARACAQSWAALALFLVAGAPMAFLQSLARGEGQGKKEEKGLDFKG